MLLTTCASTGGYFDLIINHATNFRDIFHLLYNILLKSNWRATRGKCHRPSSLQWPRVALPLVCLSTLTVLQRKPNTAGTGWEEEDSFPALPQHLIVKYFYRYQVTWHHHHHHHKQRHQWLNVFVTFVFHKFHSLSEGLLKTSALWTIKVLVCSISAWAIHEEPQPAATQPRRMEAFFL